MIDGFLKILDRERGKFAVLMMSLAFCYSVICIFLTRCRFNLKQSSQTCVAGLSEQT